MRTLVQVILLQLIIHGFQNLYIDNLHYDSTEMNLFHSFLGQSTGTFIAASRYGSATPMPPSVLSRGIGWQVAKDSTPFHFCHLCFIFLDSRMGVIGLIY